MTTQRGNELIHQYLYGKATAELVQRCGEWRVELIPSIPAYHKKIDKLWEAIYKIDEEKAVSWSDTGFYIDAPNVHISIVLHGDDRDQSILWAALLCYLTRNL